MPDADDTRGNSKILRPQLDQCPDLTDSYLQAEDTRRVSEMRLLNLQKNMTMWNECFTEHAKTRHGHLDTSKNTTKDKSVYVGNIRLFSMDTLTAAVHFRPPLTVSTKLCSSMVPQS